MVHVAGTNGKGSFIAFTRAIAEALGKGVHVYTSPHLVNFHERIVLAGPHGASPIAEDMLVDCLARAEAANGGELITLFEITTAAAFLAFAEVPADLLLLETGLGGRLDATNVVAKPLATAITPISIDHVSFLGDTRDGDRRREGRHPQARRSVRGGPAGARGLRGDRAPGRGDRRAPPRRRPRLRHVRAARAPGVSDRDDAARLAALPRLNGRHQIDNAGAAIAGASILFGDALTTRALEHGLTHAEWPARLERLRPGGLHAYVEEGTEIWLDGGHNAAGGKVIAQALAELDERVPRPVHLIFGMMETKDAHAFIAPFKGLVERIYTVPIPDEPNAFSAEALAEIASAEGFEVVAAASVPDALLRSQAALQGPGRVLICGSLYLAGHVLHAARARPIRSKSANGGPDAKVSLAWLSWPAWLLSPLLRRRGRGRIADGRRCVRADGDQGNWSPAGKSRQRQRGAATPTGLIQISYDVIAEIHRSRVGDKVKLCLVSVPENCPPDDDRGKVYRATNLRTGESWQAPDSQHSCGGA